jgi:FlaA1/EpsC-like NDP-sugar epimerase
MDLAEAIGPSCKKPITGIRPGEKIHEEMITSSDSYNTIDLGKYYAILNTSGGRASASYEEMKSAKRVPEGFYYNSGDNTQFLTIPEIQGLIKKHLDPSFRPT